MQKFKQIREAAKYNPYAIGMAAAKKKAGITAKHAENVPKAVIMKGHEIAKKIKANEEFDAELEQLGFELSLEAYTAEELQAFMESADFEQLDELSKKTLQNYAVNAATDIGFRGIDVGRSTSNDKAELDARAKNYKKMSKRVQGIDKATGKLAGAK